MAKIPDGTVDPGYVIADGTPHMTYQHPQVDINFVWDGEVEHPIMVCPGGYGEPPTDLIDLPEDAVTHLVGLHSFAEICLQYLQANGHLIIPPKEEDDADQAE